MASAKSRESYDNDVVFGDAIANSLFRTSVLIRSCFVSTFIVTQKLNVVFKELSPVKIVTDCPLAATVTVAAAGDVALRLTFVPAESCA